MNAFFCVTFILVLQLGPENAEDDSPPPPPRPLFLFFPVLSGKITFSIHKDECFQRILTAVTKKKITTAATTKPTRKPQWPYGKSSGLWERKPIARSCLSHLLSHMTSGKWLDLSSSVSVWAQQIAFTI